MGGAPTPPGMETGVCSKSQSPALCELYEHPPAPTRPFSSLWTPVGSLPRRRLPTHQEFPRGHSPQLSQPPSHHPHPAAVVILLNKRLSICCKPFEQSPETWNGCCC